MNRKLHNTTMAMLASSSLFVLGLLAASPADPALSSAPAPAMAAAIDIDHAVAVETVEASPHRHARRARQQTVAMPFFSFAPRG